MSAGRSARSVRWADGLDPVRALQRVLCRSAKQDPKRRFHALFDKVARSDVMWRAWVDVCTNSGAPGVDGITIDSIEGSGVDGVRAFLEGLADELRTGSYRPQPLRRVHIPKPGRPGQTRPLGIPTVRDRVVMTAAKIVLEPVFEADFLPSSFGFRPTRDVARHGSTETVRPLGATGSCCPRDDGAGSHDRCSRAAALGGPISGGSLFPLAGHGWRNGCAAHTGRGVVGDRARVAASPAFFGGPESRSVRGRDRRPWTGPGSSGSGPQPRGSRPVGAGLPPVPAHRLHRGIADDGHRIRTAGYTPASPALQLAHRGEDRQRSIFCSSFDRRGLRSRTAVDAASA